MEKLSLDEKCTKCGSQNVDVKYHLSTGVSFYEGEPIGVPVMRVTCARCLFSWIRLPMDATIGGEHG